MKKNKLWKKFLFIYTVVFFMLFGACFIYYYLYHKSFFRSFDGLDQHYLIFIYIGKWIRQIFENIFVHKNFIIPMWDMSIGYGGDIFTTLAAYIWDPFNWISAVIQPEHAEYVFNIIIVIKFYLSGLAFSCYAFYKKNDLFPVLCGAIIYTFSATMYIAFIQSFFINPMYIFPFVIMGVDKIWNGESPNLYIGSLAFTFINYFYFAYMTCILVFLYCCYQFISIKSVNKSFNNLFKWISRFFLFSILSIAISAFAFLPVLSVMLHLDRLNLQHAIGLQYGKNYYGGFLAGFTSSFWMGSTDCIIGFGSIAFICVTYLFLKRNSNSGLKIAFIIMTLGLCIPFVGHVMNGFGYVTNRWVWAYCLCVAYIVTRVTSNIKEISINCILIIECMIVAYALCLYLVFDQRGYETSLTVVFMMLCCIVVAKFENHNSLGFKTVFTLLTMISVIIPSHFYFSAHYKNSAGNAVNAHEAYSLVMNSGAMPLLNKLDIRPFERYDEYGISRVRNASWLYGVSGMDLYISVYNNNIDKFHNNMALLTSPWQFGYAGLDRRSELELISGVKYYLIPAKRYDLLPYSYTIPVGSMVIGDDYFEAFTSEYALPIIYGYDYAISNEEYYKYSPFERQQLITQSAVVDGDFANAPASVLEISDGKIGYSLECSDGVFFDEKKCIVTQPGGKLYLKFDQLEDSELYVYFENLQTLNSGIGDYSLNIQGDFDDTAVSGIGNTLNANTSISHMYGGKHNWLLNMGYLNKPVNELSITFNQAGEYTFDSLDVLALPSENINRAIKKINHIADDIELQPNALGCKVSLDKDQYVYFSVPYSEGWSATVNGKLSEILKANDAFMALYLAPGVYDISLTYRTPYLTEGIILSVGSLTIWIVLIWRQKRHFPYKNKLVNK